MQMHLLQSDKKLSMPKYNISITGPRIFYIGIVALPSSHKSHSFSKRRSLMFANRPEITISTYSPIDAKLRRLLHWHRHHGNQNKPLPPNRRIGDASKLTLKEKKKWINILTEEEATWKNQQELAKNNLQPITNFFKPKK